MKYLRPDSSSLRRFREVAGTGMVLTVVPLAAVGGLSAWTTAGYAGSPAKTEVREAQVLLPVIPGQNTNAYFRLVNTGGAQDRLRSVSFSGSSDAELTVHRMNAANGAYRERSGAIHIPAYGEVEMGRHGTAVTLPADASWRPGDRVTFTLDFQRSGTVTVDAVARPVTPGSVP